MMKGSRLFVDGFFNRLNSEHTGFLIMIYQKPDYTIGEINQ